MECRMARLASKKDTGFTVVELLIAVAISAILAGTSLPFFIAAIQRYRFDGAVQRVISDLRYTQSTAVTRSGCYRLHIHSVFDSEVDRLNQFRVEKTNCTGTTWPPSSATPATNPDVVTGWVNLSTEFPGITIGNVRDNSNNLLSQVIFNSRGALASPNPPVRITISSPSRGNRVIEIRAVGSMRIQ